MKYLLAIDAGTGSIRAVLFDTKGNQISSSSKEWTHIKEKNIPNSMRFDCEKNWNLVVCCIKEVLKNSKVKKEEILAISSSSMREGIVLYDKDKNPIWGVANVDARADKEVRALRKMYPNLERELYEISGQTFALGALPRLLWLKKNNPKIYQKAKHISMISDWVLAKLSNLIASEPSNAGTTGIFSLKKRKWDKKMAKKLGIKQELFGKILESGEILGNVSKKAAKECGLSSQTKVVIGGGDVQLGAVGLGLVKKGDVGILGGSFWQQIVNIPNEIKLPKDMNIRVNPHCIKNQSQAECISFFSGFATRWFRDVFCQKEIEEARQKGLDVYELLEQKAREIPVGSYGILPIFSDSMKYSNWFHAAPSFINLSFEKTNIAALFRSLEENACIVSSINLENVQKLTKTKFDTIVFAGGASKGDLWCQILADVTNCKIKVPKVKEATSLGSALFAGVGAGVYKNVQEASKKLVKWEKTYTPNFKNHKKYQKIKKKWQKVYDAQLYLVRQNLTKSMWKAPGWIS